LPGQPEITLPVGTVNRMPFSGQRLRLFAVWAVALLFALPLATVLLRLGTPADDIWAHLSGTVMPGYISHSLLLVTGTMALSAVFGIGCAWLVACCIFPGRRWLRLLLLAPAALPASVVAYAYADLLQSTGPVQTALRELTGLSGSDYWFPPIRSLGGAMVVMAAVFYPYVYIFSVVAFAALGQRNIEVTRSLGHGVWYGFFRVLIPLARPAIIGGLALVAMETLADFGTVQHFGVTTFTTGIYRTWFALGAPEAATKLAAILLVAIGLVLAIESATRARARQTLKRNQAGNPPFIHLSGWRSLLACLFCLLPVLAGFIVPLIALTRLAMSPEGLNGLPLLLPALGDTVLLSLAGGFATVAIALLLVLAVQRRRQGLAGHLQRLGFRLSTLGYAVPGTVMAVGILLPLGALDRWLNVSVQAQFGFLPGLIFSGTILTLIYAYAVRFMAVATKGIEPGLARLPESVGDAARTLGAGPFRRLFSIYIPALRPSLVTALVFVIVEVVKELPATLVLRPFGIETLALLAYRYASDERLASAALPSLVIALVGLIPVWLLGRGLFADPPKQTQA